MSEHPRCAAILQGGKQCRSVAVAGAGFCQHHNELAVEHGAEAVKRGEHLPTRRTKVIQAAVVAEGAVPTASNGGRNVDPASLRPRLAEAAAASLDDTRRVLLETATGANRNLWATINCKHSGRAGRYEITVPDNKVRVEGADTGLPCFDPGAVADRDVLLDKLGELALAQPRIDIDLSRSTAVRLRAN
jgi:hypothetical protein